MIVAGYQPLTLIDFPNTLASIVFTKGCNFRCPYCHNPELVQPEHWRGIEEDNFLSFLDTRSSMLDGVVVTGGEPTVHKDLPLLIKEIKQRGYRVKLDTNGTNPAMVAALIKDGLIDYVAMDIKQTWSKYQVVANTRPGNTILIDNCKKTQELLRKADIPYEFRTTVYPALLSEHDIEEIVSGLLPGERYFLQAMQYGKTLVKNLPRTKSMDIESLALSLSRKYPQTILRCR